VEIAAERESAIEAAFGAVTRVHRLMSAHQYESDVSRINRAGHRTPVLVDGWTAAVLRRALYWWKQSDGAFDVLRAGKSAVGGNRLPRHADQPMPTAGDSSTLELHDHLVRLHEPATVDLGGIAKGFAVDCAVDALRAYGTAAGLVNAGGDMRAFGPGLPVQINDPVYGIPRAEVLLTNRAIATSALIDGTMEHIYSWEERWTSATVCAATAMDADALTKIVLTGSPKTPKCLAQATAEAFCLNRDGTVEPISTAVA
jgi:FAD:protein FMN transferase